MLNQALRIALLIACICGMSMPANAEDGSAAWLRYAPIANPGQYSLPSRIVVAGKDSVSLNAAAELAKGLQSELGLTTSLADKVGDQGAIVLTSLQLLSESNRFATPAQAEEVLAAAESDLPREGYKIHSLQTQGRRYLVIQAGSPAAELYAVFHLLEEIEQGHPLPGFFTSAPAAAIRWSDEWDNLNGTIERGYAGRSIFFDNGHVRGDLTRAAGYARLLSSVGVNGCNVNNVNADLDLLTTEHLKEFARVAEVFRPWGVKLALSVDLTSPQTVGGLPTFDPLDPTVIAWWQKKVDEIYTLMPDFGGFTVKADSEGRKGPSQYGRSPADAANVLARALAPHRGVVLYRGFVYNNHLDWHDPKADRARAGVDNFVRYDGKFEPNVVIQIKEGPIDFQAREPVSPLFAALRHTNVAIEVQASQEYTGQQRHMVWLPSMWKWVLDTDLRADNRSTTAKEIVAGKSFPRPDGKPRSGGFISVTNVGLDPNWMHHPMAMANLYGFGKLAWNPDAKLQDIIATWTCLTWGNDPEVDRTIEAMQLSSWRNYESYTGPNGMGTLTNILGYHFGPGIESAERNGWGQWFRGERDGVGMDRTAAGTGFIQQYPPELAAIYESLAACPDDLLLFFHHVPYDHKLHSGETLIQDIYDTHYAGALATAEYVPQWEALQGKIDDERYQLTLGLLQFQAGQAIMWRDAVDDWFHRMSGKPDAQGRVGQHPSRLEAEAMRATGYTTIDVTPWETASGGKAVVCHEAAGCTLRASIDRPRGSYNIAVQYFDTWRGTSQYTLLVNGVTIASWTANDTLPPAQFDPGLDGQDSTRYTAHGVALKPGDVLELRGVPDLRPQLHAQGAEAATPGAIDPHVRSAPDYREYAPIDYLEIGPDSPITPQ